jgi:outer membrane lipoprotein LolB
MQRLGAIAALPLLLAALAGCSTLAPAPGGVADTVSGKLSVQVDAWQGAPARSVSAAFDLRGGAEQGQMQLTSPLGTVMAQAEWRPGEVLLKSAEGEKRFPDLPALADEVLGEPLPLGALFDWLRGHPWTGAPSQPLAPPAVGFQQLGWTVALERWNEGWIVARRSTPPAVTVRARLAQ